MLKQRGEAELKAYTKVNFQETVTNVAPNVWHIASMGASNSIVVEASHSVIVIDTMETMERGQALKNFIASKTDKPVKTVIFTHIHPDHRGGAGAFADTQPEYIAFAPATPMLKKTQMLADVQNLRGTRQFGYRLNDEENISQGISKREGIVYGETRVFCAPTTVYQEEKVVREIDGVTVELVRLPGETDDQIMVWLPQWKALCCADNFYACWPNLYAIRGSQYRDIATWLESLEVLRSYQADWLLPGHTAAIHGQQAVSDTLTGYHDAIQFVLDSTLAGMNEGKSMDELAETIRLPEPYASLPYLQEHYGCVEWTVRAIFTAYLGWFDGNPTHLHPLPVHERAEKTLTLMGGASRVWSAIEGAEEKGEDQWVLELCDLLMNAGEKIDLARQKKADALCRLARMETSANGRNYYFSCAQELRDQERK